MPIKKSENVINTSFHVMQKIKKEVKQSLTVIIIVIIFKINI